VGRIPRLRGIHRFAQPALEFAPIDQPVSASWLAW